MKKYMFTLCFAFAIASVSFGQLHFGAGGSLLDFQAIGVQGKVMMDLEEQIGQPIDGAVTFTYFLDEFFDFAIDFDAHYKLLEIAEDVDLAPFAGLQIARGSIGLGTFNQGFTEIGINLGAHVNIPISDFNLYVQPKLTLGGFDAFTLSGGIMF